MSEIKDACNTRWWFAGNLLGAARIVGVPENKLKELEENEKVVMNGPEHEWIGAMNAIVSSISFHSMEPPETKMAAIKDSMLAAQSFSRTVMKTNDDLMKENEELRKELLELHSARAKLRSWAQFIRECWRGDT